VIREAVIQDASVRKYIDLDNPDLPTGLAILQAAGHAIDPAAILDAPIQPHELSCQMTPHNKPPSGGFFMPGGGHMDNNWFDQIRPKVPGILGSAGALMWMQGTRPRKAAVLVLGIAASNYGTPDFVVTTGLSEGLAGFVVGMFSMTTADWVFRAWDQFAIGPLLNEWVRKRLGLPPKDGGYCMTPHFSLAELTAQCQGLDNTLTPEALQRLALTAAMLERVRAHLGVPIIVTSGYSSRAVNAAVGGVTSSDHAIGSAVDIVAPKFGAPYAVAKTLAPHVNALSIGQIIYESVGGKHWVHLSTRTPDKPVNRVITISGKSTLVGIQEA
jgi:hypothetical protein